MIAFALDYVGSDTVGEPGQRQRTKPTASARTGRQLSIQILGSFSVRTLTGDMLMPKSRKARALLAILAFHCPQAVLREQAILLLWSRRERAQAFASLRQTVHELQA